MKITNKLNLPDPILKAIQNDGYNRGDCDYTVSELLRPAYMNKLLKKYDDKINVDCSTRLYALLGKSLHDLLEKTEYIGVLKGGIFRRIKCLIVNAFKYLFSNVIVEKRFYMYVNWKKIGGKPDRIVVKKKKGKVIIQDYKVMSTWEYIHGFKKEKTDQLNIYAMWWLLQGYEIEKLEIISFFRDWKPSDAEYNKDYPQTHILKTNLDIYSFARSHSFVKGLIKAQEQKRPKKCTNDEMWIREEKYAVMKKDAKRATRLLDYFAEAELYIRQHKDGKKMTIVHRQGRRIRCERYCDCNKFCPEFKKWSKENEKNSILQDK